MQNALTTGSLYEPLTQKSAPAAPSRRTSLARHFARRWDLYGVLALMGSSAAYALYALSHLG